MALVKAETMQGFSRLPALRQIGLMIGLAASVALGVAVVLWSQSPNYSMLYGNLSDRDSAQVLDALSKANIPYKVDPNSGAILVPAGKVYDARMKLATQGLPKGSDSGFRLLEKNEGFGTSQFMETARYQHALEGELAQTIASMDSVNSARVHLALPKRSVFMRKQNQPTASVMVSLYAGRSLDRSQVAAVVHLVAASVPGLSPDHVTVVDEAGHLLTSQGSSQDMALSGNQFNYTQRIEQDYAKRIVDLLSPLVGAGDVKAQVNADLNFTVVEKTQETYNPDMPALRSEQTTEHRTVGASGADGIPGALSNQPPAAGTAPANATANANGAANAKQGASAASAGTVTQGPVNSSKETTRNYELDKTISHIRLPTGTVRRLSVAVVVNDHQVTDANGQVQHKPWSDAELARFTSLVKEVVGFNGQRGDRVSVINAPFQTPAPMPPAPPTPVWKQPWVWTLAKQLAGGLGVLLLVLGVLRPVLRSLAEKGAAGGDMMPAAGSLPPGMAEDRVSIGHQQNPQLTSPQLGYDQQVTTARGMVQQDPKRVAQVVKNWVNADG
ncbi:MAG: flagellar basal-body MS-ring/collar protein FliF [Gammaproteobacteria bacterium]